MSALATLSEAEGEWVRYHHNLCSTSLPLKVCKILLRSGILLHTIWQLFT